MKLKLDADGHVVVQDGRPVYIEDDGTEVAFDAPGTRNTITRLNTEAKNHRQRAEAAETAVAAFEGITDPAAARKALETVANLDQKKLVDAGQVEQANAERDRAWQAKLDEANGKATNFEQQLYSEMIGGNFARSKFIADKLAVPADMVQATFGRNLKIEEGKVVAYDAQGQKIFSRSRPGELADFDEALETLVSQYPHRAHILKSSDANGSGALPGADRNTQTPKKLSDCKTDAERVAWAQSQA
ncbi:hypothetical protein AL532_17845 [Pseudomonas monteilii]|uniref:DUF6651 domain-containing protein n=1 Tax=Pseudomonas TaxID=286 RepID=UPI000CEB433F|nr:MULTISPECIES: DUF6651 domain-containing protein [Pseudomonas]AVH38069.1 hypothetical protein AL532_17845 [Pseudomonas monteilii]